MSHKEFLKILPELAKNYEPAEDVHSHIGKVSLLMTVGPSSVGKTTVMRGLELPYVPSDTTRVRRRGEVDGVDYHFRDDYSAVADDIVDGRFVQIVIGPGGDLYATKDSSYPESGPATMAVMTDVIPVFRNLGFKRLIGAFIVPPDYSEWMRRISVRNFNDEDLQKRLAEARRSLSFAIQDKQMHFILNDEPTLAISQTKNLLEGRTDKDREEKAKSAAEAILEQLS